MLPLRAPIPLVTLFLSAACQTKEGSSSGSETDTESGAMVTTGSLEFPPVECHRNGEEGICPAGQICVFQSGDCNLAEIPQCDDSGSTGPEGSTGSTDMSSSTGTEDPEPDKCWDWRSTYTCTPIPMKCMSTANQQAFADCILADNLCYDPDYESFFADGLLSCPTEVLCREGGDYRYGYCDLDCF